MLGLPKHIPPTLHLRMISGDELARFDGLMEHHHRRGALRRICHKLHYIALGDEEWISFLSFSPAALQWSVRDRSIGWHRQHRTDRLMLVADNSCFLILTGHHCPNLASRILSGCRRSLSSSCSLNLSSAMRGASSECRNCCRRRKNEIEQARFPLVS